jgi:hypothetical protein
MITFFTICFILGLGFSMVMFLFGGGHHAFHFGHHTFHLPHPAAKGHAPIHGGTFNFGALSAFLATFGAAGVVLMQMTQLALLELVGGSLFAGLVGGGLVNAFLRRLMAQEEELKPINRVGMIGKITSSIREGGTGEIVYSHSGTRHVDGARSESGRALPKGTEVVITRYENGIAYVCTWDELPESEALAIRGA